MTRRTISLLGSTGSIGRQSLDVIAACDMQVAALTANRDVGKMEEQCRRFAPALGESQGRSPARMEKGNAVPGFSAKAVDNLCTMWYIANIDHKKLVK